MPRIASHHRWKDPEHVPSEDWPEDCTVQWGSSGIVLGKTSRVTAFFEAFPSGSFIRGEGETIAAAEEDALAQYRRKLDCKDHHWQRGRYANGGATCKRCGCFETRFHPVVTLGGWRDKPDLGDLTFIIGGTYLFAHFRALSEGEAPRRHHRERWLRLRVAGIALPPLPTEETGEDHGSHPWTLEARDRIMEWAVANGYPEAITDQSPFSIEGFFSVLDNRCFKHAHTQWLASRTLQ